MKAIFKTAVLLLLTNVAFLLEAEHSEASPSLAAEQTPLLDDDALMARLQKRIWGDNDNIYPGWTPWDLAIWFRKEAGNPSDERMHAALTAIYREAETREGKEARDLRTRAVLWLGVCADDATKAFLLEVAADTSKDGFLRTTAISSYLRNADAEETKDMLLQFLAGDHCGIDPLSVYSHAAEVYDHTPPEDGAKRRAIIAALMIAAAREEGKIGFVEVDRILAMRSDTYRRSHERLAMLEHHSLEPPTKNLYTDADLKAALAESRSYISHTSVNTNAAMLQTIDFNEERPADDAETWGGKLVIPSQEAMLAPRGVQPEIAEPQVRSGRWRVASLGGLAVVVTAFVLFILHRKAGGK